MSCALKITLAALLFPQCLPAYTTCCFHLFLFHPCFYVQMRQQINKQNEESDKAAFCSLASFHSWDEREDTLLPVNADNASLISRSYPCRITGCHGLFEEKTVSPSSHIVAFHHLLCAAAMLINICLPCSVPACGTKPGCCWWCLAVLGWAAPMRK